MVLLASCQSQESKINESITKEFKKIVNDPSKFELVSVEIIGEETMGDLKLGGDNEATLLYYKFNSENKDDSSDTFFINLVSDKLETNKKMYAFVKKRINDDEYVALYKLTVIVRATNDFGALIMKEFRVMLMNDEDFTVESIFLLG